MTSMKKIPMRLAMRVEGDWWVAYLAKPDTMDGAEKIGMILMGIARDPERKQVFLDLMKAAMGDAIKDVTGTTPDWNEPRDAPESERSGNA
jgi:hypothetical protein